MSLKEDVDNLKLKLADKEINEKSEELKNFEKLNKKKSFKIPFKFRLKNPYKKGRFLIIWLGANHYLDFKWGLVEGGVVKILDKGEVLDYNVYEKGAVYFHKRYPVGVVFEWRLGLAGGNAEEFGTKVVGGDADKELADKYGFSSAAQRSIIRAIKNEEIAKDEKKKKKLPIGFIILLIGIVLFIIGKAAGVV